MDTSVASAALPANTRLLVLLPIGSIEQHGPYLPMDTDLRIATLLAEKLEQVWKHKQVLRLPAFPFSCSYEHTGQGTISIDVASLAVLLRNIAQSLRHWPMPCCLILINWHGGNDLLAPLATEITSKDGVPCAVIPALSQVGIAWEKSHITSAKDVHAGAVETSVIRAFWPMLLSSPLPSSAHDEPDIRPAKVQAVLQALGSRAITQQGIWGAPEDADPDKGHLLIEQLVQQMSAQIEKLLQLLEQRER